MAKKGGWFRESRRHSLASKGIKTKGRREHPRLKPVAERVHVSDYRPIRGQFVRMGHEAGSGMSIMVVNVDGDEIAYPGDARMLARAIEDMGLKPGDDVTIQFREMWDWYIEAQ